MRCAPLMEWFPPDSIHDNLRIISSFSLLKGIIPTGINDLAKDVTTLCSSVKISPSSEASPLIWSYPSLARVTVGAMVSLAILGHK